jgi:hypothetical protein
MWYRIEVFANKKPCTSIKTHLPETLLKDACSKMAY